METKRYSFFLGLVVLGIHFLSVSALKCMQCMSIYHSWCESGKMEAKNCTGRDKDACIKYVGESSHGTLLLRDCGSKDRNNTCEVMRIHNEDIKVCFSTCTTDGCNTAPSVGKSLFNLAYVLLILVLVHDAMS